MFFSNIVTTGICLKRYNDITMHFYQSLGTSLYRGSTVLNNKGDPFMDNLANNRNNSLKHCKNLVRSKILPGLAKEQTEQSRQYFTKQMLKFFHMVSVSVIKAKNHSFALNNLTVSTLLSSQYGNWFYAISKICLDNVNASINCVNSRFRESYSKTLLFGLLDLKPNPFVSRIILSISFQGR